MVEVEVMVVVVVVGSDNGLFSAQMNSFMTAEVNLSISFR